MKKKYNPGMLSPNAVDFMWHPATKTLYKVKVICPVKVAITTPQVPKLVPVTETGGHPWVESPMWSKRINGFCTYFMAALVSLLRPVEVDKALRDILNDQFQGEQSGPGL